MKDRLRERLRRFDLHFATKLVCYAFFIAVFVITIWICIDSPVQHHLKISGKMTSGSVTGGMTPTQGKKPQRHHSIISEFLWTTGMLP